MGGWTVPSLQNQRRRAKGPRGASFISNIQRRRVSVSGISGGGEAPCDGVTISRSTVAANSVGKGCFIRERTQRDLREITVIILSQRKGLKGEPKKDEGVGIDPFVADHD